MKKSQQYSDFRSVFDEADQIYDEYFLNHFEDKHRLRYLLTKKIGGARRPIIENSTFKKLLSGERTTDVKLRIRQIAQILDTKLKEHPDKEKISKEIFGANNPDFYNHLFEINEGHYDNAKHVDYPDAHQKLVERTSLITSLLQKLPTFPKEITSKTESDIRKLFVAARLNSPKPYVVYHFRQMHCEGIHWVDFYFLKILAILKDNNWFEALVLITEKNISAPTIEIAKQLLGKNRIITDTEASKSATKYNGYSLKILGDAKLKECEALIAQHKRGDDSLMWMQFIPYHVREKLKRESYLQFVWKKHYKSGWDFSNFYNLNVVHLLTEDVKIGDVLAKQYGPPLLIEPYPCPSFRKWLSGTPTPTLQEVEKLLDYFDALDKDKPPLTTAIHGTETALSKLQKEWAKLLKKAKADDPLCAAVDRLAIILDRWDNLYFKSRQTNEHSM